MRRATSRSDLAVLPLLAAVVVAVVAVVAGLTATAYGAAGAEYDYRTGVPVWFRSLLALDPDVPAMAHAPLVTRAPRPTGTPRSPPCRNRP